MFCYNCGKEIKDEAKFCNYCGAKQDTAQKRITEQNSRKPENLPDTSQKGLSMAVKILLPIAIVAVAAVCILAAFTLKSPKTQSTEAASERISSETEDSEHDNEDSGVSEEIEEEMISEVSSAGAEEESSAEAAAAAFSEAADPEEETESEDLKGIIFIYRDFEIEESYAGGAYHPKYTENTPIEIYALDPDTGEYEKIREFPYIEGYRGTDPYVCAMQFNNFDENYERMSLSIEMPDGSSHTGWITQDGDFTDVTEQTTVPGGDFSGLTSQYLGHFGPDDYFYFSDDNGKHRVPLNSLTPEAVEDVNTDYGLWPDGSVGCSYDYYYDSSLSSKFTLRLLKEYAVQQWVSWVNPEQVVYTSLISDTLDPVTIMLASVGSDERTELVPNIKDRWNYNPVVSPDGTKVAFLSSLRNATDNKGHLFVTGFDGEEPVKIDTDLSFTCFEGLEGSFHLMEWR